MGSILTLPAWNSACVFCSVFPWIPYRLRLLGPHLRHSSAVPAIFSRAIWVQAYLFYNSICSHRWLKLHLANNTIVISPNTSDTGAWYILHSQHPLHYFDTLLLWENLAWFLFPICPKDWERLNGCQFLAPWGSHTVTFQYPDCFSTPNLPGGQWPTVDFLFFWGPKSTFSVLFLSITSPSFKV